MSQSYPDLEGFAYSFARAELTIGPRTYTAITSVSFEQATEEGVVKGTKPYPIARTEGTMGMGSGTVTFSDERERIDLINDLGDGYRNVIWQLSWVLSAPNTSAPDVKLACQGCRILNNAVSHEEGGEALGGDIEFSFMSHTVNGNSPHGA